MPRRTSHFFETTVLNPAAGTDASLLSVPMSALESNARQRLRRILRVPDDWEPQREGPSKEQQTCSTSRRK